MPDPLAVRILALGLAYLLDLVLGDPRWFPHPVRGMGWLIQKGEPVFRALIKNERVCGSLFASTIILLTWATGAFTVNLSSSRLPSVGFLLTVGLLYTTIAAKDLAKEGGRVARALESKNLEDARRILSGIVGRDTENLNEQAVMRATVETVAENTVDGVIAPVFYACLGGAPLALAYKAINTLDSMIGYKNEKYRNFGWFAARVDDAANFIPARAASLFFPLAAHAAGGSGKNAWKIMRRDGRKHPSPNSGIAEAAVAGALGIQLGGLNFYQGIPSEKPLIGDNLNSLTCEHIEKSIGMMHAASCLFLGTGVAILLFIAGRR